MNIIFHYYVVNYLCKKAGFSEQDSYIISNSSAFLDKAIISFKVKTSRGIYNTEKTTYYEPWNKQASDILMPFHFFPGDINYENAKRVDGHKNRFNTTPNSPPVKEFLIEALKSKNLYRIGIALHTFMDSFSHQNFIGTKDNWNKLFTENEKLYFKTFLNGFFTPMGHVQAGFIPDDYFCKPYIDQRLVNSLVSNEIRFMEACRKVYKYLCAYNNKPSSDTEFVIMELENFLNSCKGSESLDTTPERVVEILKRITFKKTIDKSSHYLNKAKEKSISLLLKARQRGTDFIKKALKRENLYNSEYNDNSFDIEDENEKSDEEFKYFDNSLEDANLFAKFLFEKEYNIIPYNSFMWQDEAIKIDDNLNKTLKKTFYWLLWGYINALNNFTITDSTPIIEGRENFFDSDFYKWSESAKEQRDVYRKIYMNL